MCEACEAKKALAEALGAKIVTKEVGKLDAGTVLQLELLHLEEQDLEKQIKDELEEAARQVKAMYQQRMDDLDEKRRVTYNGIYDRKGLDKEKEYDIDRKTGVITVEEIVSK